jgi:hypothetical protein
LGEKKFNALFQNLEQLANNTASNSFAHHRLGFVAGAVFFSLFRQVPNPATCSWYSSLCCTTDDLNSMKDKLQYWWTGWVATCPTPAEPKLYSTHCQFVLLSCAPIFLPSRSFFSLFHSFFFSFF